MEPVSRSTLGKAFSRRCNSLGFGGRISTPAIFASGKRVVSMMPVMNLPEHKSNNNKSLPVSLVRDVTTPPACSLPRICSTRSMIAIPSTISFLNFFPLQATLDMRSSYSTSRMNSSAHGSITGGLLAACVSADAVSLASPPDVNVASYSGRRYAVPPPVNRQRCLLVTQDGCLSMYSIGR